MDGVAGSRKRGRNLFLDICGVEGICLRHHAKDSRSSS
jgi:hypothetical protein